MLTMLHSFSSNSCHNQQARIAPMLSLTMHGSTELINPQFAMAMVLCHLLAACGCRSTGFQYMSLFPYAQGHT